MNLVMYAIPFFILLMAAEYVYGRVRDRNTYRLADTVNSLSLGTLSRLSGLLKLGLAGVVFEFVRANLGLATLPAESWVVWVLAFVGYDLCYYWSHRYGHRWKLFWAAHVAHHQSEAFNLSTALRQTSTGATFVFYLPLYALGFPTELIVTVGALNLIYQFWVHTEHVPSLGPIEWLLVTPSNHRVHHAKNPCYVDRNFGGVFIIWDRLFGTFTAERAEEPCVYGITHPLRSWNPLWANAHVWLETARDSVRTRRLRDKVRMWFSNPGWRPDDLPPRHEDWRAPEYDPPRAPGAGALAFVHYWAVTGAALTLLLIAEGLAYPLTLTGVALLAFSFYVQGTFLEGRGFAVRLELLRLALIVAAVAWWQPELGPTAAGILFSYAGASLVALAGMHVVRPHFPLLTVSGMDEPDELIRQHLQLIYDNTRDLVFLIEVGADGDYRVASVNRAYLDRTQLQPDRVIGRSVDEILRNEQLDYVRARYDEAVRQRGPSRYETRTTLRGQTIYLDTTLVPVFDDDGRCTHLIGVSRDISDNKRERQALRHEKQRAENYLDIAEALILALDPEGNVTLLNRKGYHLLGYPEGSLLGRNWCELVIAPEKRAAYIAGLRRAFESGEVGRNVNYVRTSDGDRRLISWANALIRDDDGNVVGVLSSGEDITDQRRAEQAMIASQRVLAANEVVAAVAHDFNNALQGILGNIELALSSDAAETLRAHLETAAQLADDAAQRLQVLRGPSTASGSDDGILDPNELIDDVIAQTRPLWKDEAQRHGRDLRVRRQLASELPPISGNRGELRSVLYNIVKNAVEAIDGSGTIVIESRSAGGDLLITVADDGIGMDSATSTRIFQPFFSTKGMEVGRGLGMSASNNIVRAHGGEIRVAYSAPREGTTIEVRIPTLRRAVSDPGDVRAGPPAGRHHILWVDDDPQIRALASDYLSVLRQTGDVVESGERALQMLLRNTYSVVITDIGMPGMNGLELAERVRQATDGRVPVIALTGWGDTINVEDLPPAGVEQVITKPVRLHQLRETLKVLQSQPRTTI